MIIHIQGTTLRDATADIPREDSRTVRPQPLSDTEGERGYNV